MKRNGSISMVFSGVIAAGLMLVGSQSVAAPVVCYTMADDRYMTLESGSGDAACVGSGSGMNSNKSFHDGNGLGLVEIEKLEDGVNAGSWFSVLGLDATSGNISVLNTALFSQYSNVHVAFTFGNPNIDPNWMSYALSDVFHADWTVFSSLNKNPALSNVALWGNRSYAVPAPASLGLFALGLMGLTVSRWRRQQ